MPSVVSLGSVNVDHVVRASEERLASLAARHDRFPAAGETVAVESMPETLVALDDDHMLGGKGANQAVAAVRAGSGSTGSVVTASFLGRVGEDAPEYDVLPTLTRRGVDVSGVETVPGPTGAAHVFVDETAENRIAISPGANGAVDGEYVAHHREAVLGTDVLLLQNEVPVEPVDSLLADLDGRADRPTVVLDPAPADGAAPLLTHDCVDVVTPNAGEADSLAAELDAFDGTVVRTRGPDPVLVEPADGDGFTVPPPPVEAVDTTGAGDVFAGYLAAGIASGEGLRTAVERATVAAALSVTRPGVQRATPTLEEVRAFEAGSG